MCCCISRISDLVSRLRLSFTRRTFTVTEGSFVVLLEILVDLGNVDRTFIRGHAIGDFFRFGREVLFDSAALLEVGHLSTLANSSATFAGGFVGRINQLTSDGKLTFMQNSDVTYQVLSISSHSLVEFTSVLGAVIAPTSTIELSGALLAIKLVVMGSLIIPSFANVTIDLPVISDVDAGCSIRVYGHLMAASYFQLKTCEISGGGHLSILHGIVSGNVPALSVHRLSIFKTFVVASGSSVAFASSIVELVSCVAKVAGNVFANLSSQFILFSDSSLMGQHATFSGFGSMTMRGSVAINNSLFEASSILFLDGSSVVCASSTIRTGSMLTAGDSFNAKNYLDLYFFFPIYCNRNTFSCCSVYMK
jgi:hypothetical protein